MKYEDVLNLAAQANQMGAEGVFVLRDVAGLMAAYYNTETGRHQFSLDLYNAPLFMVIRFPLSDGQPDGVESL